MCWRGSRQLHFNKITASKHHCNATAHSQSQAGINLTKALAPLAARERDEAAHMRLHSGGTTQVFSTEEHRQQEVR